jgi:hypothetical protein
MKSVLFLAAAALTGAMATFVVMAPYGAAAAILTTPIGASMSYALAKSVLHALRSSRAGGPPWSAVMPPFILDRLRQYSRTREESRRSRLD